MSAALLKLFARLRGKCSLILNTCDVIHAIMKPTIIKYTFLTFGFLLSFHERTKDVYIIEKNALTFIVGKISYLSTYLSNTSPSSPKGSLLASFSIISEKLSLYLFLNLLPHTQTEINISNIYPPPLCCLILFKTIYPRVSDRSSQLALHDPDSCELDAYRQPCH